MRSIRIKMPVPFPLSEAVVVRKRSVGRSGRVLLAVCAASPLASALAQEVPAGTVTLPPVKVRASAGDAPVDLNRAVSSGALGSISRLDTPFSNTAVSAEQLAERQPIKLGDVFALDASVTDNSGGYSSWASYVTVRGLPLDWQNGYRMDGRPFLSYAITLPYDHFEQIELLKGSSGFMYGFGSPGGVVNYVSKRPTDTPVRSVDVGYTSNSLWREHADLGGRFGNDGMFGYRVNVTHEEGKTYNDGTLDRNAVSLALDARLTTDLTWNFNSLYQKRKSAGQTPSIYTGTYAGTGLPSVINGDSASIFSPGQHLETEFQLYATGVEYRLTPDWTLASDLSYSTSDRSRNEGILYLTDASGAFNEWRSDSAEGHRFTQWQATAKGSLATGALRHQVVAGVSLQQQANYYSTNSFYQQIGTGSLYGSPGEGYASVTDFAMYRDSDITQRAVFVSDTLQFSPRWSVVGGLRHTGYDQASYTPAGAENLGYDKGATTPTVALLFKPDAGTTLYGSYIESLEAGSRVGQTYANEGLLLKPLKSRQYELGAKTERGDWSATAALFRIERVAEYANASNELVQDGRSIYQGLELEAAVRLGAPWQLSGSVMALDSQYDRGNANVGNRVAGAAKYVAAARVAYDVAALPGLKLTADAKYTGRTMLNAANTIELGGYVVANVGASYVTRIQGCDATFRIAVNNAADKRYWEYQYESYVKPADPRTVALSARLDF